ncbi:DUF4317 domain-containing protein [Lachnospiraceae bacterium ZAX-1]
MNKKEVLEIKKQYTPDNCTITRICGCYVDHEKQKKFSSKSAFHSLPEEEAFKYFEIFKQTLAGTLGKHLLNMDFPLEQEQAGGTQEFLLKLRNDKLQNDELLETFYDRVIASYDYAENYYIILIHVAYDIPGKATDGMQMFDASDSVYEYLQCSICPVALSKAGLSYNFEKNNIEERMRDWIVGAPITGFLFPVLHDQNADLHSVLYYSKKPEEIQPEFIEQVLGSELPMTADTQKESFHTMIADAIGEEFHYEVMRNIHENLQDMIVEHKEDPEPLTLSKPDVARLLEHSGVSQGKLEVIDQEYENKIGGHNSLLAANIASTTKFNIETPDIIIKVNPDRVDLIETRMIDDRKCLVIAVDEYIEVNGVTVKTMIDKA